MLKELAMKYEVAGLSLSSRLLSQLFVLVVRLVSMVPMLHNMSWRNGSPSSSVNVSEYAGSGCFFFPMVYLAVEAASFLDLDLGDIMPKVKTVREVTASLSVCLVWPDMRQNKAAAPLLPVIVELPLMGESRSRDGQEEELLQSFHMH